MIVWFGRPAKKPNEQRYSIPQIHKVHVCCQQTIPMYTYKVHVSRGVSKDSDTHTLLSDQNNFKIFFSTVSANKKTDIQKQQLVEYIEAHRQSLKN